MNNGEKSVAVVIATSKNRTQLLFDRSLRSVYLQTRVNPIIVIVDDNMPKFKNCKSEEFDRIVDVVQKLRETVLKKRYVREGANIPFSEFFETVVIPNTRTQGVSGTGAWNTALEWIERNCRVNFVSILDDDDEYLPTHLSNCLSVGKEAHAIFSPVVWRDTGKDTVHRISKDDISEEAFFVGNPGVQGSNMLIRHRDLMSIGGFDENLHSATDRDLMIRFIRHLKKELGEEYLKYVEVLGEPSVIYHTDQADRVTSNRKLKKMGLDVFYKKYKDQFSKEDFQKSLDRAKRFFGYKFGSHFTVHMPLKNQAGTIRKAIESVLCQEGTRREIYLLIADDRSTDEWTDHVSDLLEDDRVLHISVTGGSASKVRNIMIDYTEKFLPNTEYIARLDADDVLMDSKVFNRLEEIIDQDAPDVIFSGNLQALNGDILARENRATRDLGNPTYLEERLRGMSKGDDSSELPSCNVVFRPNLGIRYPDHQSAEDHWLLVELLMNKKLKHSFAEDLMYCVYTLNGNLTIENKQKKGYYHTRRKLHSWFLKKYRRELAEAIVKNLTSRPLTYLGEGFSGIVLNDGEQVFKVHIPISGNNYSQKDSLRYLISRFRDLVNTKFFFDIEVLEISGFTVVTYPYEEGENVEAFQRKELIELLAYCWNRKFLIQKFDLTSFIRVRGQLKLVDYEIIPYSDNRFLNSVAEAYLYLTQSGSKKRMKRLKRSIINNFSHHILGEDYTKFLNEVLQTITFGETVNENISIEALSDPNQLKREDTEQSTDETSVVKLKEMDEKVTLLIKTCPQDHQLIYYQIRHIVHQLRTPNDFYEKLVVVDPRERDYLREFSSGDYNALLQQLDTLKAEGIIDNYLVFPKEEARRINKEWFNCDTTGTHTIQGIPVAPQLYGFEIAKSDYILQLDSDVLIGRKDRYHPYLEEMISALKSNPDALSVGFNIPNYKRKEYHADPGDYKPEVRFALLDRRRLLSTRPWPNRVQDDKPVMGWYHSLHKLQKMMGKRSLRGGSPLSFYIHPQNYRKRCDEVILLIMDRVEKGLIPEFQYGRFDLEGSFDEWMAPKRNEKIVVFTVVEEEKQVATLPRLLRSLKLQGVDWGAVVFFNGLDERTDYYLEHLFSKEQNITYLCSKKKFPNLQLLYTAVTTFVKNDQSFIIPIDPRDYLLGNNVLEEFLERASLYDADLIYGKHIVPSKPDLGLMTVDFTDPRADGLGGHLKAFRLVLLLRLGTRNIMKYNPPAPNYSVFEKKSKSYEWYHDQEFTNLFSLLAEIAENPVRFDFYNCVVDRRAIDKDRIKKNLQIIKGRSLRTFEIENSRIDFKPNLQRIEIDITYRCNLKCHGCNRSSAQVPGTGTDISLEQIKEFIEDSIKNGKKWKYINILGGEPTIHPNFLDIISLIIEQYIETYSPKTILQITSNGYSRRTREILDEVPKHPNVVFDHYTTKDSNTIPYFTDFNDAPVDHEDTNHDYRKGCWVTSYCGIGLNKYGYFPCGVAGGIYRVTGLRPGAQSLSDVTEERMKDLLEEYCKYCGNFQGYASNFGNFIERCRKEPFKGVVSRFWKSTYNSYNGLIELDVVYKHTEEQGK